MEGPKNTACGCKYVESDSGRKIDRRQFLTIAGWGAFFATIGAWLLAIVRFVFPRVLFEPPSKFKAGYISDVEVGSMPDEHGVLGVSQKYKEEHRAVLVREKDRLYAIFLKCTHLGCTPNYFPEEHVFKCPCHGSEYYANGVNFAGPAPRPMDRYKITIADDGKILIDKSVLYTYKDFDNPNAYLKV
jgi:cytochrome b6-f complex iron-sulfur subunit